MNQINALRKKMSQSLAKTIGGRFRVAQTGTPHVVIQIGDQTYSICYFTERVIRMKRHKAGYRIFWPFPSGTSIQEAKTYRSRNGVVQFINKLKLEALSNGQGR